MNAPYTLVLLRHGESTWNKENKFTGWTDVPLSDRGTAEAVESGKLMAKEGYRFDVVHTSLLWRAIQTANLALDEMGLSWLPVKRHWRLNERHYGSLQGLNKKETAERLGKDQVFQWRRSYDVPPPPLGLDDDRHPSHDRRYADLDPYVLPATECLKDVVERMMPYWSDQIVPDLRSGKLVLIVAHGNSLRALVKHLDQITDEQIASLNIPTGIPLVYHLDEDLRKVDSFYLGDPEAAKRAAEEVAKQAG
ncbi:MAG: 2,3-diphosphoglycerate-dependent phosphoglycerate mutase [Actinobacteria bacterium]|nr:2,3-diphosphoglycerate-dependent phosphoglycerate mutase [Actinomycetota bacterium]